MQKSDLFRYALLIFVGMVLFGSLSAQEIQRAKDMAQREAPPDSIIMLVNQIVEKEKRASSPNSKLLGTCYFLRAKAYYDLKDAQNSYSDAVSSFKYIAEFTPEAAPDVIELLEDCRKLIAMDDLALPVQNQKKIEESIFFSISEIVEIRGDTVLVKVKGGSNEGITDQSSGGVLSVYTVENPERGNEEMGNARVTEVHPSWCLAEVILFERSRNKGLKLITGDNIMLKAMVPETVYRGNLFKLTSSNILLRNSYRNYAYHHTFILRDNNPFTEEAIIRYLLEDQKGTAAYLYDSANATFMKDYLPFKRGSKIGLNMWEAMLQSNIEDMRAFHRFVISFPAKYMGREFRSDETYATWLINATPPGNDEIEYTYDAILGSDTSRSAIISLASKLKYYLSYYSDTVETTSIGVHLEKVADRWRTRNEKFTQALDYPSALKQTEKLLHFASWFSNDTFTLPLLFEKASLLQKLKRIDEALQVYDQTLSFDIKPYNSYWFRAYLFYEQERNTEAFRDFAKVSELAPWSSSPLGMQGWILLKTGKFNASFEYCRKAYEMDSFNHSWVVNFGHAYFMRGETDSARILYDRAMSLIKDPGNFYSGMIADFDTFLSNGWEMQRIRAEKTRVIAIWNEKYRYRLQADSCFQAGKDLHSTKEFTKAISLFEKAIENEKAHSTPDMDWIRAYSRWIAFSHYKAKDYVRSLENYKKAYLISRDTLKNTEYEILDLQDMANICDWLGMQTNKEVYRQLAASLQRKQNEKTQSNRLIVVSLAGGKSVANPFNFCEKDAINIAGSLQTKGAFIYDTVFTYVLTGKQFTRGDMNRVFKEVLTIGRPGDALVFYYSGNTFTKLGRKGFILGNDSLDMEDLHYWSSNILSRKQLFIWDIPNDGHTDAFLSLKNKQTLEGKGTQTDLILLSNQGTRIEPDGQGGLLSAAVFEALEGKANTGFSDNDRSVSAKELEAFVFDKLGRNNYYLQVTTFSEGLDFPLVSAPLLTGVIDYKGPKVTFSLQANGLNSSRAVDIEFEEEALLLNGQAIDEGGVEEVWVNNQSVSLATNGKFSYVVTETENTWLYIKAKDKVGNLTLDSIMVFKNSDGKKEIKKEVVNRALLFGTDIYDEFTALKNPISDVLAIGKLLEEYYGYQVTIVKDATQAEIREKLDSFLRLSYGPQDQLFVFFAGHGMLDNIYGGHIVCKDSKKLDKTRQTYYPFHQLAGSLNGVQNCQHILLVLDVCFGGQIFSKQWAPAYMGQDVYSANKEQIRLNKIMASKSRMFITSGGETYVPDGRPGYHSPFASRFIQALENPLNNPQKSYITLKDIVDYLRDLPENQEPRYGSFGNESELDKNADIALMPVKRYGAITQNASKQSPAPGR